MKLRARFFVGGRQLKGWECELPHRRLRLQCASPPRGGLLPRCEREGRLPFSLVVDGVPL
eukprot:10590629-Prorocentrum_lima.AAC.1